MLFRALCFCFAVAITAAVNELEDPFKSVKVKAIPPDDPKAKDKYLVIKCTFDLAKTDMSEVTKLRLWVSDGGPYKSLAGYDDKASYGMSKDEIKVKGKLKEAGKKSKLLVKYKQDDLGYCRKYKCQAYGRDSKNNKLKAYFAELDVGAEDGGSCE